MNVLQEIVRDGRRFLPVEAGATVEYWPELTSARSLGSKTYSSPDGRQRCVVASIGPVHYREGGLDSKDVWQDIDLSNADDIKTLYRLSRLKDGIGYTWTCREDSKESVTVRFLGFADLPKPEFREGGVVYWTDVAPGLDIYMRPAPDRYGIFKVLKDERAPRTFRFGASYGKAPRMAVTGRGVSYALELESVLQDGISDLLELRLDHCHMPARVAWDKDGNPIEVKASIKGDQISEEVVLPEGFAAWPVTVDTDVSYQTGASTNDGYSRATYWNSASPIGAYTADDLFNIGGSTSTSYRCQARFVGVQIPKAGRLLSAVLRVKSNSAQSASIPYMAVKAHAADNSAEFAVNDTGIWTRTRTAAAVAWSPGEWVANAWYDSPDIKTVIQEVVDRDGWVAGNALTCFLDATANMGIGHSRQVCAYELAPVGTSGPKLLATYADPDAVAQVGNAANLSLAAPSPIAGLTQDSTILATTAILQAAAAQPGVLVSVGSLVQPPAATLQCAANVPTPSAVATFTGLVGNPARVYLDALTAEAVIERSSETVAVPASLSILMGEPIAVTSGNVIQLVYPGSFSVRMGVPVVFAEIGAIIQAPAAAVALAGLAPETIAVRNVLAAPYTSTASLSAPAPVIDAIANLTTEAPAAVLSIAAAIPSSITTGGSSVVTVPIAALTFVSLAAEVLALRLPLVRRPGRPLRLRLLTQPSMAILRPFPSRAEILTQRTEAVIVR